MNEPRSDVPAYEKYSPLFTVADLIFAKDIQKPISISEKDLKTIKEEFLKIVNSLEGIEKTKGTKEHKFAEMTLPYNAMSIMTRLNDHLVLHCSTSYAQPMLFIIDMQKEEIRNYIDIEVAKIILNDKAREKIDRQLSSPFHFGAFYPNIKDVNMLAEKYAERLRQHKNLQKTKKTTEKATDYSFFKQTIKSVINDEIER